MNLLIYFALPIATIILAVVLEKIIRCPYLTAATFFAIYLIVTFAAFDASFLIFTIIYTILAFVAALIAEYFYTREEKQCHRREHEYRYTYDNQGINTQGINTQGINTQGINTQAINADRINANRINANSINTNGRNQGTWCCYRRN